MEKRKRQTKQKLKTALITLMKEKPISSIKVLELCNIAGLNRTTFYLHYKDQFELFAEIEHDLMTECKEYISNAEDNNTPIDYIEAFLNYFKDNSEIFTILINNGAYRDFQERYLNIIIEGINNKIHLQLSDEQIIYVYSFVVDGSLASLKKWVQSDFNLEVKEMAALLYNLCDKCLLQN